MDNNINIVELRKCIFRDDDICKAGINGTKVKCWMYNFENGKHICNINNIEKTINKTCNRKNDVSEISD